MIRLPKVITNFPVGEDKKLSLDEKVAFIKSIVEAWYNTKTIKVLVENILNTYDVRVDDKKILALFFAKWIKENIKYIPEPPHFNDRIKTPLTVLHTGFGDCTEHAILLACILKFLGIDFTYVMASTNPNEKNVINHIYIEAEIDGKKIPLDTTERFKLLGEEPINFYKVRYK